MAGLSRRVARRCDCSCMRHCRSTTLLWKSWIALVMAARCSGRSPMSCWCCITKAIQDFQSKVVDLQWRMQEQSQRLATLLDKPAIDQTAALAQLDEVLGVEREVKRAHITLLINIKNTLSADQQAKLATARATAAR